MQVIRAGEGPGVASQEADYVATLLSACPPQARRDMYLVTAEPGPARASDPHMPGVVEHVVVSSGRARVGPAEDPVELGPGDYMAYPGDLMLDDASILRVIEATADGGLCCVHAENGTVIDELVRRLCELAEEPARGAISR